MPPAIIVNLSRSHYYHGETVSVTVCCIFTIQEKVKDIQVTLIGEENTSWVNNDDVQVVKDKVGYSTKAVKYSGSVTFLSINQKLLEKEKSFVPGEHNFKFALTLPKKIPKSYKSDHASVKYYLKVFMNDVIVTKDLQVRAPLGPEDIIDRTKYRYDKVDVTQHGPVDVNVTLDKSIFILGEMVKVEVKVMNKDGLEVSKITAEIGTTIDVVLLQPSEKLISDYVAITSDEQLIVRDRREKTKSSLHYLRVPQNLDQPNFTGCRLLRLFPIVKVMVVLSDFKKFTVTAKVPIFLVDAWPPLDAANQDTENYFDLPHGLKDIHLTEEHRTVEADPPPPYRPICPEQRPPVPKRQTTKHAFKCCWNTGSDSPASAEEYGDHLNPSGHSNWSHTSTVLALPSMADCNYDYRGGSHKDYNSHKYPISDADRVDGHHSGSRHGSSDQLCHASSYSHHGSHHDIDSRSHTNDYSHQSNSAHHGSSDSHHDSHGGCHDSGGDTGGGDCGGGDSGGGDCGGGDSGGGGDD